MDVERIFMMNNCGAEFGAARCVDCLFPSDCAILQTPKVLTMRLNQ